MSLSIIKFSEEFRVSLQSGSKGSACHARTLLNRAPSALDLYAKAKSHTPQTQTKLSLSLSHACVVCVSASRAEAFISRT